MENESPESLHPRPGGFSRRDAVKAGTFAAAAAAASIGATSASAAAKTGDRGPCT